MLSTPGNLIGLFDYIVESPPSLREDNSIFLSELVCLCKPVNSVEPVFDSRGMIDSLILSTRRELFRRAFSC